MELNNPLRVGLVGTGYAAKVRAETLGSDSRVKLLAVSGHQRTAEFAESFGLVAVDDWTQLVQRPDLDLVVISTVNRDHARIARAALQANKHVVLEYPLALNLAEGQQLLELATAQQRLLHVEHIELLSGIHTALRQGLPKLGQVLYIRYSDLTEKRPAPQRWSYASELFGFPLMGAVSRIHRLTDLFGPVQSVSCQSRVWGDGEFFNTCLTSAHLQFAQGSVAEVVYGKGEALWRSERVLEIHCKAGALLIDGETGVRRDAQGETPLELGSRRGLFARDSAAVLAHLFEGEPLYVSPQQSLYALQVADAARRAAETGETVHL
ncbi:Gfo/Idh/MocA family protein [Leptolyngbya sp. FACHB-261]|uniref:Gfo/Idh/MocA family protein n=1 Tax=Leptolyngbya sp. FACHB-261 TaxID=2692806 RepID=UPI0016857E4B|nr:Gfo/Idh/MocA family oxidoreductase [Leptolyngbya sp. FACHB-261]MBD2100516.1 Gfo/Idh/MocA family oxidoreductase [Leptolyngbya sp. FACHB-261]